MFDFFLHPKAKSKHEGSFDLANVNLGVQWGSSVLQNVGSDNLNEICTIMDVALHRD